LIESSHVASPVFSKKMPQVGPAFICNRRANFPDSSMNSGYMVGTEAKNSDAFDGSWPKDAAAHLT